MKEINRKKRIFRASVTGVIIFSMIVVLWKFIPKKDYPGQSALVLESLSNLPFNYTFNVPGQLEESESMSNSSSPYWWLNSGGKMIIDKDIGKTFQSSIPENDPWRKLYSRSNKIDTDNGYHPQNLFRLILRGTIENFSEEVYFMVLKDQLSNSPNRDESNGLLLLLRYKDEDDLYYAGIRVDGTAVIKKKENGVYYTLAQTSVIPGKYNRLTNPNLLPKNKWIGIKADIISVNKNRTDIRVYTDIGKTNTWKLVLEGHDDGTSSGPVINGPGYAGIRTDFMDVAFSSFKIGKI